jgi:hypothetical protein
LEINSVVFYGDGRNTAKRGGMRQATIEFDLVLQRKLAYFDALCRDQMWHTIWGCPRKDAPENDLIALSGAKHCRNGNVFDEAAYNLFVDRLVSLIGKDREWIYEIGAGAGAMLSQILQRLPHIAVAGCDYSKYLCDLAPKHLSISNHSAHRAVYDGLIPFDSGSNGVFVSIGAFMYFPDLRYADFVLRGLIKNFPHSPIILSEIPDLDKKEQVEAVRGNTGHLFFPKDFFRTFDREAQIIDYDFCGSVNSGLRYTIVLNR